MPINLTANDAELLERFQSLNTSRDVAGLLEVNFSQLTYYLYRRPIISNYKVFRIIKKTGGERIIYAPISPIKILQRKLNNILQLIYSPKRCVQGFVPGKSILTNAQTHIRRGSVLNIDLSNFFPSINFGRVRGMFMANPYSIPEKPATVLAQICCVDGHIPQGAPTSPVVSNMICGKLDSDLLQLARRFRCSYTRYADDITFSTTRDRIPSQLGTLIYENELTRAEIGDLLRSRIESNGFSVNSAKLRIQGRGTRQEVTGLTVNSSPNVRRKYIRQIRAIVHAIEKFGFDAAEAEFHTRYYHKQIHPDRSLPSLNDILEGKLNFLRMVKGENDIVYRRMYNKFLRCLDRPRKYITEPLDVSPSLWVLESEEAGCQGSAFMLSGVGLVTCWHVLQNGTKAFHWEDINRKFDVEILAENSDLDVAILAQPVGEYATLEAGNPNELTHGNKLILAGFPNYRPGNTPYITEGKIATFRTVTAQRWILVNTPIIAGHSGGPVLNQEGRVIGIAATGADRMEEAPRTEHHGIIPISVLTHLTTAN